MGKIRTVFNIIAATTLLGATLLFGYTACTELKKSAENKKKAAVIEKVVKEITKKSLEGMMWPELSERKPDTKLSDQYFNFDNAEILKSYHNKNSDKLVVYIRDIHKSSVFEGKHLVQENLYNTIDELYKENSIDLLVLEGTPQEELTKEWINSNVNVWYQKLFWYIFQGFWVPENKEEALKAFSGGVAYEYMNDTKIETCGAEDEDVHNAAWYIATSPTRSEGKVWLFEKIISDKRSEIGVEKTLQYMEKSGKKKAIIVFGAAHTKRIAEMLEEKGISYIVIQPKGADDYIQKIEKCYK